MTCVWNRNKKVIRVSIDYSASKRSITRVDIGRYDVLHSDSPCGGTYDDAIVTVL
jgi:hypothetical protein